MKKETKTQKLERLLQESEARLDDVIANAEYWEQQCHEAREALKEKEDTTVDFDAYDNVLPFRRAS